MMQPTNVTTLFGRRAGRALGLMCLLVMALGLAGGCNRAEKKKLEERKKKQADMEAAVAPLRHGLAPGESATFEFEADGYWHPTPYVTFAGEHIKVVPDGIAAKLGANTVDMLFGKRQMLLGTGNAEFTVSSTATFHFRVTEAKAGPMAGQKLAVKITRTK